MANYDIVIRNGQVADGTGKKLFAADVALKGDRIAAVEAPARRPISKVSSIAFRMSSPSSRMWAV